MKKKKKRKEQNEKKNTTLRYCLTSLVYFSVIVNCKQEEEDAVVG